MADEPDNDSESTDEPPTSLRSGRVRIVGAEPADQLAGLAADLPVDGDFALEPSPSGLDLPIVSEEPAAPVSFDSASSAPLEPLPEGEPDLPHWTEAPTGEVPAVLKRETESADAAADPWAAMPSPTWREEHTDWEAQEETFEPSMLAHDDTKLGSLDDSGESDLQPWSFELPGAADTERSAEGEPERAALINEHEDDQTMVVPAVTSTEPVAAPNEEADQEATDEPALVSRSADVTTYPEGSPAPLPIVVPALDGTDVEEPGVLAAAAFVADQPIEDNQPRSRREARAAARGGRGRASATRPVPLAPEERPVDPAEDQAPAPRPVPAAPPPVQAAPRPRPGGGLRPPEPPRETASGRNLPVAIASGLVIGVLALVCFSLGSAASVAFVTVLAALAVLETFAAFRKAGYHPVTLLGLVATISLMVATYNKGFESLPLVIVLLVAFVLLWHLVGVERAADPVRSTASTLFVFCWIAVFASYAALLLNPTLFPDRHGIAFLLGAVITAVAYDVAALAVGSWIGSRPLAPNISPNKTWEGLIGGAVGSIVAAVLIVQFIHPWTFSKAFALGVVVAIVSPLGDLSESLIKRHLGLKDMGRILPGHGGLLDRMDGLLFVLPATYYLVKALHLG